MNKITIVDTLSALISDPGMLTSMLFYAMSVSFQIAGGMLLIKKTSDNPERLASECIDEVEKQHKYNNSMISKTLFSFAQNTIDISRVRLSFKYVTFGFIIGVAGYNPYSFATNSNGVYLVMFIVGIITVIAYYLGYKKLEAPIDKEYWEEGAKAICEHFEGEAHNKSS